MMTQNCGNRFSNPFTYVEKTKKLFIGKKYPAQLGGRNAQEGSDVVFF